LSFRTELLIFFNLSPLFSLRCLTFFYLWPLISLNISSHFYPIINMLSVMTNMLKNRVRVMVLNTTFNNISVISWRWVLLVEETGVPGENHRPVASHWQILSHNVVSCTPHLSGIRTRNVNDDRHWLHK
jgi:hypothetical protein